MQIPLGSSANRARAALNIRICSEYLYIHTYIQRTPLYIRVHADTLRLFSNQCKSSSLYTYVYAVSTSIYTRIYSEHLSTYAYMQIPFGLSANLAFPVASLHVYTVSTSLYIRVCTDTLRLISKLGISGRHCGGRTPALPAQCRLLYATLLGAVCPY